MSLSEGHVTGRSVTEESPPLSARRVVNAPPEVGRRRSSLLSALLSPAPKASPSTSQRAMSAGGLRPVSRFGREDEEMLRESIKHLTFNEVGNGLELPRLDLDRVNHRHRPDIELYRTLSSTLTAVRKFEESEEDARAQYLSRILNNLKQHAKSDKSFYQGLYQRLAQSEMRYQAVKIRALAAKEVAAEGHEDPHSSNTGAAKENADIATHNRAEELMAKVKLSSEDIGRTTVNRNHRGRRTIQIKGGAAHAPLQGPNGREITAHRMQRRPLAALNPNTAAPSEGSSDGARGVTAKGFVRRGRQVIARKKHKKPSQQAAVPAARVGPGGHGGGSDAPPPQAMEPPAPPPKPRPDEGDPLLTASMQLDDSQPCVSGSTTPAQVADVEAMDLHQGEERKTRDNADAVTRGLFLSPPSTPFRGGGGGEEAADSGTREASAPNYPYSPCNIYYVASTASPQPPGNDKAVTPTGPVRAGPVVVPYDPALAMDPSIPRTPEPAAELTPDYLEYLQQQRKTLATPSNQWSGGWRMRSDALSPDHCHSARACPPTSEQVRGTGAGHMPTSARTSSLRKAKDENRRSRVESLIEIEPRMPAAQSPRRRLLLETKRFDDDGEPGTAAAGLADNAIALDFTSPQQLRTLPESETEIASESLLSTPPSASRSRRLSHTGSPMSPFGSPSPNTGRTLSARSISPIRFAGTPGGSHSRGLNGRGTGGASPHKDLQAAIGVAPKHFLSLFGRNGASDTAKILRKQRPVVTGVDQIQPRAPDSPPSALRDDRHDIVFVPLVIPGSAVSGASAKTPTPAAPPADAKDAASTMTVKAPQPPQPSHAQRPKAVAATSSAARPRPVTPPLDRSQARPSSPQQPGPAPAGSHPVMHKGRRIVKVTRGPSRRVAQAAGETKPSQQQQKQPSLGSSAAPMSPPPRSVQDVVARARAALGDDPRTPPLVTTRMDYARIRHGDDTEDDHGSGQAQGHDLFVNTRWLAGRDGIGTIRIVSSPNTSGVSRSPVTNTPSSLSSQAISMASSGFSGGGDTAGSGASLVEDSDADTPSHRRDNDPPRLFEDDPPPQHQPRLLSLRSQQQQTSSHFPAPWRGSAMAKLPVEGKGEVEVRPSSPLELPSPSDRYGSMAPGPLSAHEMRVQEVMSAIRHGKLKAVTRALREGLDANASDEKGKREGTH